MTAAACQKLVLHSTMRLHASDYVHLHLECAIAALLWTFGASC